MLTVLVTFDESLHSSVAVVVGGEPPIGDIPHWTEMGGISSNKSMKKQKNNKKKKGFADL